MAKTAYPIINNVSCSPEVEVRFQTFNRKDSQTYRGKIVGSVNFDVAMQMGTDLIAVHENMETDIAKMDLPSQTFILVQTKDMVVRPFAVCWINSNTFINPDNTEDTTIVIHDITKADAFKVMTYIRDLGYDVSEN